MLKGHEYLIVDACHLECHRDILDKQDFLLHMILSLRNGETCDLVKYSFVDGE